MANNDGLQTVLEKEIQPGDFDSGGEVSSEIKDLLRKLGVPAEVVRKASIAAYELEMNIIIHSEGGEMETKVKPGSIKIIARDQGPGIKDVEKAFQPGYSTAGEAVREMGFGAGMGLCNVESYSDRVKVESEVKKGTRIEAYINFER